MEERRNASGCFKIKLVYAKIHESTKPTCSNYSKCDYDCDIVFDSVTRLHGNQLCCGYYQFAFISH